jgi:DNA invertase Pin-like site-specific DNA recombinase
MGWEIFKEYTDKAKAPDLVNRKLWNELLKDAAAHKFDTMLIWKLGRVFRSVTHATLTLTLLNNYHVGFRSLMANNNNFSATARALTGNTGVEVSAGFVASRIKQMAAKEALQRSGVKIRVSDT